MTVLEAVAAIRKWFTDRTIIDNGADLDHLCLLVGVIEDTYGNSIRAQCLFDAKEQIITCFRKAELLAPPGAVPLIPLNLWLELWGRVHGVLSWVEQQESKNRKPRKGYSHNEERNKFAYECRRAGDDWKTVKKKCNARDGWRKVKREEALQKAAREYALKHSLPWPV